MPETGTEHTPEGEAAAQAVDEVQHEQAVTEVAVDAATTAAEAMGTAEVAVAAAEDAAGTAEQAETVAEVAATGVAETADATGEVAQVVSDHDAALQAVVTRLEDLGSQFQAYVAAHEQPEQSAVTEVHVGNADASGTPGQDEPAETSGTGTGTGNSGGSRSRRHKFGSRRH